jgi:hypothetical protein
MAEPSDLLKESFDRLNTLTTFALTSLMAIGYAVVHHDTVVVIDRFTIDVQFIGMIVYLLLAGVNTYVAATLQSARAQLLVAEKEAAAAEIAKSGYAQIPFPSTPALAWWHRKTFMFPRPTLVESKREQFRNHSWLCNPYSETGPGLGRVTDCLGIIILCLLWSFGGCVARYYRPILTIPGPVHPVLSDPSVQRIRSEREATRAAMERRNPAAAAKTEPTFPVVAPPVACVDGAFLTVVVAQLFYLLSFCLVVIVIGTSLHEVALDRRLLLWKLSLTVLGGAIAIVLGIWSIVALHGAAPDDMHEPLVIIGRAAPMNLSAEFKFTVPPPPPPLTVPEQQFIDAVKRNDPSGVCKWLATGVVATTSDVDGTPAIVLAADRGEYSSAEGAVCDTSIIKQLLAAADGALLRQRDPRGRTALTAAAEQDNHELVGFLAEKVRAQNDYDQIARVILLALERNDSVLLERVGQLPVSNKNDTSLMKEGRARLTLHNNGIPLDPQWLVRQVSRLTRLPAEKERSVQVATWFAEGGFPLTVQDENGSNLLMLAYRWQNDKLAGFLADRDDLCSTINRFHEDVWMTRNRYCPSCPPPSRCAK